MGLLVVTVFILALVGLGEGICNYTDCVFAGLDRASGVEYNVLNMNFDAIPDDIAGPCGILVQREANCSSRRKDCPQYLTRVYSKRFYDARYVGYIMDVGVYVCNDLAPYLALRDCVTGPFKATLQSFIKDGTYNGPAILKTIATTQQANCTLEKKSFLTNLFNNKLRQNPYNWAFVP